MHYQFCNLKRHPPWRKGWGRMGISCSNIGLEVFCHIVFRNQLSLEVVVVYASFISIPLYLDIWYQTHCAWYQVKGVKYMGSDTIRIRSHVSDTFCAPVILILMLPFCPACNLAQSYRSNELQTRPKPVK